MNLNILQRFLSLFKSKPDPEFIAQQLRKPTGDHAQEIGDKMDQVNEALFDLTLDVMRPQDNEAILEIGFGTGNFFDKLFARADGLQVSGIDYSEKMVETAKRLNRTSLNLGRLNIKLGRSDELPYPDRSFDKVFCNMVIYFWDHPEEHLREIHRILKPGGKFYTGLRTRKSMLHFPFVEYGFNLYETSEWNDILIQNGFSVINTHSQMDPEIDFEGNTLRLESCCIVARKNSSQ